MYRDLVVSKIESGRLGLNKGLPHGLDRMLEYIPGIQQKTYYLIGGETGTGKSSFTNNNFVFTPIDWYLKNKNNTDVKLKVFYYSFEIPKEDMFIKAINRSVYLETGVLLDINYVLSRGKYRISDEHYKMVLQHAKMLEEFNDIMIVKDIPTNPTGLWYDMLKYAENNGTGIKDLQFLDGQDYKPNNPNEYVLIVIDHISLSLKERGFATKDTIDKLSEYLIILRNKCGYTPIVVQQLNRSLSSTERFKLDRLDPQLSDFKDSGNTQQDANVVLTLFSPNKYDIKNYRGYDITRLKDRYRALGIAKNRDGEAEKVIGLQYVGECGYFKELPRKDQMKESDYVQIESIKKSF